MTATANAERYCSQHHQPRSQCRPADRHVQTLRARSDTWDQLESMAAELNRSRAELIESLAEAALGFIRCYRCGEPVPVRFGDLRGMSLAEVVIKAELAIARKHPSHAPFRVGGPPAADAVPDKPAPPGTVKFMEPKQAAR